MLPKNYFAKGNEVKFFFFNISKWNIILTKSDSPHTRRAESKTLRKVQCHSLRLVKRHKRATYKKITKKLSYKEVDGDTNHDNKKQKMADLFSATKRNSTSIFQRERKDRRPHFLRCGYFSLSILPTHKPAKLP